MIYEFRTYKLKPGSLAEVEKRFGAGYEHRKNFSPLTAFWHTEIGPLNEIIHVWGYKDQAERTKIRAEAGKPGVWPPNTSEFIVNMKSEIVHPFPFVPDLQPGKMGPIFRDALLHDQAGHAARHHQALGGEDSGADQVLAAGAGRARGARPGQ